MSFHPSVTPEEIALMPPARFAGRIVVVDSDETMRMAEEVLSREPVIGYDTETRPNFQKGEDHGIALVQLSTADTAFLFRVKKMPLSSKICEILSCGEIIKSGAAIRDDIRGMRRTTQFDPCGFVDLQSIAGQWGIEELSVKKMAALVLKIKMSKAQRLTNWEAVRLTDSQQQYAAMDAWVCREIFCVLREADPGRMEAIVSSVRQQQWPEEKKKKKKRFKKRNDQIHTQEG